MVKSDPTPKWLRSMTAKVLAITTLLAAVVGLVNGAVDVYRKVTNVATNIYDRTNETLFRKNFGRPPLVSQPVQIKLADVTVEMLLQVYDTGDVFVRYGDFQQWLPFRQMRTSSLSFVTAVLAQVLPLPGGSESSPAAIVVNIDKLKQQAARPESPTSTPGVASKSLEKTYVIAKMKDDHPIFFGKSTATYTEVFEAEKGYRISTFKFELASANNARVESQTLSDDGKKVTMVYSLTSGPVIDQYRAWIQGTLKTTQQRTP